MTIIIDTREKNAIVYKQKIEKSYKNVKVIITKLDVGDYSFIYNNVDFRNIFVVERKDTYQELKNNLCSADHKRFKAEFQRAIELNIKDFEILIHNSESQKDLFKCKFGGFSNKIFYKTFHTFVSNRNNDRLNNNLNAITINHTKYLFDYLVNKFEEYAKVYFREH
jgi:hypothetical protein